MKTKSMWTKPELQNTLQSGEFVYADSCGPLRLQVVEYTDFVSLTISMRTCLFHYSADVNHEDAGKILTYCSHRVDFQAFLELMVAAGVMTYPEFYQALVDGDKTNDSSA